MRGHDIHVPAQENTEEKCMSENDKKVKLRSAEWFGTQDKNGFMYRSWMKNQGIPDHEFEGKPIIGICNTWSELTRATPTSASWPNTSSAASSKPAASRLNSRCSPTANRTCARPPC
jgi:dihydroxyacid dehydratase/phosphogluconate dehydratase